MEKHDIAGLKIDGITKEEFLKKVQQRLTSGTKTFVITPYSEFLYHSLQDPTLLETFNKADFAVPDGIGIFLAARFLSIPITAKNYFLKIVQAVWHMAYSGAAILLYPTFIRNQFPEKISGSELIWDLSQMALQNNWSIFLLGGFGHTPELVTKKLTDRFPKLTIAGWSSKNPDDPTVIEDINSSHADMIFVAYGPIQQERWVVQNMDKLVAKFYIGLGGTFDYIAGVRVSPPKVIRSIGLEWLYRLVTQPHRWRRIWNATVGLTSKLIGYKVALTLPFRKNVVAVIINKNNDIFVGLRKPNGLPRNNGHWMFPQGGVEEKEDVVQAATREVGEETGITTLRYLTTSKKTNRYLWPFWFSKKYKGQEQTIVYFKFEGPDSEINLVNHHTQEFVDFEWLPKNALLKKVHPLRKKLGTIVSADLDTLL